MENFSIANDKKVGVLLSGGLDSTIMTYLLIKNNPDINITFFTIPKRDGAMNYADAIIEHFNKKFGKSFPKTIPVGNVRVYHRHQSTTAVIEILNNYDIDLLFIGINKNPPELMDIPHAPQRETESKHEKIIYPFVKMLKSDVIKIMFDEGQEDIMNITHTCTQQEEGRCGVCWQCTERSWAFSKLGKVDTGTS